MGPEFFFYHQELVNSFDLYHNGVGLHRLNTFILECTSFERGVYGEFQKLCFIEI